MAETEPKRSIDLPSRITIYPSQDQAIDRMLGGMLERCPAQFALIAEKSGQLVSVLGERGFADPVVLASLIAGDMAASQEIARVTGQYQHFQYVLREGLASNTIIAEAGEYLVLFVQVKKDVPLGWARLVIIEASHKLAEIIAAQADDIKDLNIDIKQDAITGWVDDALNSLWKK
jgi:predicted regulator of Ras-like GTPase activity (Roadblock/LC7/MglB family)